MSLKLVIDMNLPPDWVGVLGQHGYECVHWISIGPANASDRQIMDWALAHKYAVFTHDLDFGAMLALTHASGPSVLQVRALDVMPEHLAPVVVAALHQHEVELSAGALVVVDEARSRVRLLPI